MQDKKNKPKLSQEHLEQIEAQRDKKIKEYNEMKSIINTLFSSPDGMKYVKEVMKLCKIGMVDDVLDHAHLAHRKGVQDTFNKCFKNFIEPELMAKIERLK